MKELQELRNEVLSLRNMGELTKQTESILLHKLNALQEAINYTHCCETLRDEKAPTIEINLNTKESAYKRCNEITKVLKAPCKIYLYLHKLPFNST